MAQPDLIRVLLVDDHQVVRQGLLIFLSTQPGIEAVGEAANGVDAVRLVDRLLPDVVLMDLILPEMNGLAATQTIHARHPDIKILVLTSFVDDEKVMTAFQAGAAGYLLKDVAPLDLARAIKAVARGEVYLHSEAARLLTRGLQPNHRPDVQPNILTEREREVLQFVARGLSNRDIADRLGISLKTVKVHVSNILQKLQIESRVQAALYALQHNLISPS